MPGCVALPQQAADRLTRPLEQQQPPRKGPIPFELTDELLDAAAAAAAVAAANLPKRSIAAAAPPPRSEPPPGGPLPSQLGAPCMDTQVAHVGLSSSSRSSSGSRIAAPGSPCSPLLWRAGSGANTYAPPLRPHLGWDVPPGAGAAYGAAGAVEPLGGRQGPAGPMLGAPAARPAAVVCGEPITAAGFPTFKLPPPSWEQAGGANAWPDSAQAPTAPMPQLTATSAAPTAQELRLLGLLGGVQPQPVAASQPLLAMSAPLVMSSPLAAPAPLAPAATSPLLPAASQWQAQRAVAPQQAQLMSLMLSSGGGAGGGQPAWAGGALQHAWPAGLTQALPTPASPAPACLVCGVSAAEFCCTHGSVVHRCCCLDCGVFLQQRHALCPLCMLPFTGLTPWSG